MKLMLENIEQYQLEDENIDVYYILKIFHSSFLEILMLKSK